MLLSQLSYGLTQAGLWLPCVCQCKSWKEDRVAVKVRTLESGTGRMGHGAWSCSYHSVSLVLLLS